MRPFSAGGDWLQILTQTNHRASFLVCLTESGRVQKRVHKFSNNITATQPLWLGGRAPVSLSSVRSWVQISHAPCRTFWCFQSVYEIWWKLRMHKHFGGFGWCFDENSKGWQGITVDHRQTQGLQGIIGNSKGLGFQGIGRDCRGLQIITGVLQGIARDGTGDRTPTVRKMLK